MVPIEISYSLIKRRRLSGKGLQNGDENDCKKRLSIQYNETDVTNDSFFSLRIENFFLKSTIPYIFQLFFLFEYL